MVIKLLRTYVKSANKSIVPCKLLKTKIPHQLLDEGFVPIINNYFLLTATSLRTAVHAFVASTTTYG